MARPNLDSAVYNKYMSIPLPANVCQVEYVWIGGTGSDLRGKTKTLEKVPTKIEDLPIWNYDGS